MKKLLPILLILFGGGGGIAAGYFLRPPPEPEAQTHCAEADPDCVAEEGEENPAETPHTPVAQEAPQNDVNEAGQPGPEYVALQRQMIVPIVNGDQVISLIVMSLSVEVQAGYSNDVYDREPKLRDAFLQVLFRHANTGGFNGEFTSGEKMSDLRNALNGAASSVLGSAAIQVLVTDIMRQET